MHITWIRHGQTDENVKGTYYGELESQLTIEGIRQIQTLKDTLDLQGEVYVSPSSRTLSTAEHLFGQKKFCVDTRLKERHMGKWEGLVYHQIKEDYPKECAEWDADWITFKVPEGESAKAHYKRVGEFIQMLEAKGADATVVAHAGTIRMAMAYMLGDINLFWRFKVDNGGVVKSCCHEGYWYLESISNPLVQKQEQGKCILVTGGVRSGKSKYAESLFANTDDVLYLATAKIIGEEMAIRVQRHREWRNQKWETHEGYRDLDKVILKTDKKHILLDCVTIFTSNFMFEEDEPFEERTHKQQEAVLEVVLEQMNQLIDACKQTNKHIILVTNEVGNGIVPAYALGRIYRDYIGIINSAIAKKSDEVYEVKCGLPIRLK